MAKNFLIITEGVSTEPTILEAILKKYGFNVIQKNPMKISEEQPFTLDVTELLDDKKDNIYIAQGPRNRIRDFLNLINKKTDDVERYFSQLSDNFAGIFLVYDVDHTPKEDLENMFFDAMKEAGIQKPGNIANPVGGCDSTPFQKAGVKSITFAAQNPVMSDYYHTFRDVPERFSPETVGLGLDVVLRVISKIEESRVK